MSVVWYGNSTVVALSVTTAIGGFSCLFTGIYCIYRKCCLAEDNEDIEVHPTNRGHRFKAKKGRRRWAHVRKGTKVYINYKEV